MKPVSSRPEVFRDALLGELVIQAPQRVDATWRGWHGRLAWRGDEIELSLGGDARAPDRGLLRALQDIVRALDEVLGRADAALRECAPEHDIRRFRVSSISSWDELDEIFEIRLEPRDGASQRPNVETTWPAGRVVAHRVVIGRDYRAVLRDGALQLPPVKLPSDHPDR